MSENPLPTALPTRQAAAIEGRSARNRVTGKLKIAIEAMIWEGLPRAEAAAKAGMVDSSLRFALRKPHVLAHHNAELAALRTSLRARNAHRLNTIAQESPNHMASVAAIKTLEGLAEASEQHLTAAPQQTPGLTIVIHQPAAAPKIADASVIRIEQPGMPSPPSGFSGDRC
jgi:hypothetical protein